jgi:hypothetical protein
MIACIEVDHKPSGYKLFAGGAGLQFYVKGSTVKIVDKLANVVMNKAIEVNGTTRGVTLERRCPCQKKVSDKQLKLL